MIDKHLDISSEVYDGPLFDDTEDDINFRGNIIRSAITITNNSDKIQ